MNKIIDYLPNKMKKYTLNEEQLYQHVHNIVEEQLREGFMDWIKGAGSQAGGEMAQGARNMGNRISNGVSNTWNRAKQTATNAAQNAKNFAQRINRAGQMGSMNAENQKIADQLQKWFQSGVFGNSRTASSCVSQLINALNGNFNSRFGEMGTAQRMR